MARRRRARTTTVLWNGHDWRRAWKIALSRIDGAPTLVSEQMVFHHALEMLDCGFVKGDVFQFQLGMLMIMDCCNEAIERGDCYQWWVD